MEESQKSRSDSGCCTILTLILSYGTLVGSTFLSVACSWAYTNNYDTSDNVSLSGAAAILSTIALCGATLGICGCGTGGGQVKMGMGFLWQCIGACDDMDNEICVCCRVLAGCGLVIIIVPSFGILQAISGGLMAASLVNNAATNVKVFAGFIAAFDFLGVVSGFLCSCMICITYSD